MREPILLSDHFTIGKLLRFTVPSMVMMVFISIYSVIDGFFVSNFAGTTSFAALNLVFPFVMFLSVTGFVFGAGGTALIAKTLGKGMPDEANRIFSMLVYLGAFSGVLFAVVGWPFLDDVSVLLGADEALLGECVQYGRILLVAMPFFMLEIMFHSMLIAAEKPDLGLIVTLIAGGLNIALDALFIAGFGWGLKGAAWATALSQLSGATIPLVYFICPNSSRLRLGRFEFNGAALRQTCFNGTSEFFSNISSSVVAMLYNYQLMKYIGEDGVAAYGVVMYVAFIFTAVNIGYGMGSGPIVSFHYGAGHRDELRNVFTKSMMLIGIMGLTEFLFAQLLARPLAQIFVGYDPDLLMLTTHALRIYSISFLLMGFNGYASAFFTALNNGLVSAAISTNRTMLCETLAVLLLPLAFGVNGIWHAIIFAEVAALVLTVTMLVRNGERYGYR